MRVHAGTLYMLPCCRDATLHLELVVCAAAEPARVHHDRAVYESTARDGHPACRWCDERCVSEEDRQRQPRHLLSAPCISGQTVVGGYSPRACP